MGWSYGTNSASVITAKTILINVIKKRTLNHHKWLMVLKHHNNSHDGRCFGMPTSQMIKVQRSGPYEGQASWSLRSQHPPWPGRASVTVHRLGATVNSFPHVCSSPSHQRYFLKLFKTEILLKGVFKNRILSPHFQTIICILLWVIYSDFLKFLHSEAIYTYIYLFMYLLLLNVSLLISHLNTQ